MIDRADHDPAPASNVSPSKSALLVLYGSYLLLLAILFFGGAELVLRAKGLEPWQAEDARVSAIRVEPGGKFFQNDPALGYSHLPGTFAVTLGPPPSAEDAPRGEQFLRFTVTHLPNTLRITRPVETYASPDRRDAIWIFGCSYTHGWSVNDNESYPWLLQERFPDYDVVNFGVSGYGTVHSLLQFRDALKKKSPRVVVLSYADFHDVRNTFSRERRKLIVPYNRLGPLVQPYARLDRDGTLRTYVADVEYREFPLMRYSAFAHFIETTYNNKLEPRWLRSQSVSQALILEMARLTKQHGIAFVVANINGPPMTEFYRDNGITNIDIAIDARRSENTNNPFDSHPSALAHVRYAEKLERILKAELALKKERP